MAQSDMTEVGFVHLEADPARGNMVILKENQEADLYFLMFVGDAEFAAIAKEKGLLEPKRPLTHDLYLHILENLPLEFARIEIYDMRDETFYARVIFQADGVEQSIDSRPSDAVALALNRKVPILVKQNLLRRQLSQEEVKEWEGLVKTVKF